MVFFATESGFSLCWIMRLGVSVCSSCPSAALYMLWRYPTAFKIHSIGLPSDFCTYSVCVHIILVVSDYVCHRCSLTGSLRISGGNSISAKQSLLDLLLIRNECFVLLSEIVMKMIFYYIWFDPVSWTRLLWAVRVRGCSIVQYVWPSSEKVIKLQSVLEFVWECNILMQSSYKLNYTNMYH